MAGKDSICGGADSDGPCRPLLDDSESEFFDCINAELTELSGITVNYYAYHTAREAVGVEEQSRTKVCPIYGEPKERDIEGPFNIPAHVKWPEYQPISDEGGFAREFDCICVISRSHLDDRKLPYPSESDVIEMWRTPYHDDHSMGVGMFFDVIKAENDGHINDTATFTQFKLYMKRRTPFGAERRITPP